MACVKITGQSLSHALYNKGQHVYVSLLLPQVDLEGSSFCTQGMLNLSCSIKVTSLISLTVSLTSDIQTGDN